MRSATSSSLAAPFQVSKAQSRQMLVAALIPRLVSEYGKTLAVHRHINLGFLPLRSVSQGDEARGRPGSRRPTAPAQSSSLSSGSGLRGPRSPGEAGAGVRLAAGEDRRKTGCAGIRPVPARVRSRLRPGTPCKPTLPRHTAGPLPTPRRGSARPPA